MSETFKCHLCSKSFADGHAQRAHHKSKHGNKKMPDSIRKHNLPRRGDDDDSYASRAIDAQLDHAMGIHNHDYDWLVEPFK